MIDGTPAGTTAPGTRHPVPGTRLEASHAACRTIMRAQASTFSLACRLLPPERRRATEALYGLFRTLDDLVDESDAGALGRADALAELRRWRRWFDDPDSAPPEHPVVPAFQETVDRFAIPSRYFVELTDGLEADVCNRRYADFPALALYCYRVAATVGLAMCHVLGVTSDRARHHAVELGVAMQLTNILRDVREDAERGRVYLPLDELAAAGWDEARLRTGPIDEPFRALMRQQVLRARSYYDRGVAGLPYLSPDARFAILVAARAYGGILDVIERRRFDVFAGRARVSLPARLRIVAGCYLARHRPAPHPGGQRGLAPGEPTGAELLAMAGAGP
jgi:phytoene synthase